MAIAYSNRPLPLGSNCQILLDFNNPKCYTPGGSTFTNLIDPARNNGYLKSNVTQTTDPKGGIALNPLGGGAGRNLVGDRIDIQTSAADRDRFSKDNNFSFIFWVRRIGGGSKLLSTGSSGSTNNDACIWQMWIDNGQFYWWNSGGGGANNITCSFTPCPDTTNWYMVTVTFESNPTGTNFVRAYRDGVLQNTGSRTYSTHDARDRRGQTNLQWTLGGGYSSSCVNANSSAVFSMFALYNKTLSQNEITDFYNKTKLRFLK